MIAHLEPSRRLPLGLPISKTASWPPHLEDCLLASPCQLPWNVSQVHGCLLALAPLCCPHGSHRRPQPSPLDSARAGLEIGRESVRRAQELAKEAILGFFPTALMQWPSPSGSSAWPSPSGSSGGSFVKRGHERAEAEDDVAMAPGAPAGPADGEVVPAEGVCGSGGGASISTAPSVSPAPAGDATSILDAAEALHPPAHPAPIGNVAQAANGAQAAGGGWEDLAADEGVDSHGVLQLQLLRNYFVAREPTAFSALGAALHLDGASVGTVGAMLATGECDIEDGGTCGWSPLSLSLLRGDAYLSVMQLIIDARANIEAAPTSRKGHTPLLLAAASRQEGCVRALLAARASLHVRDHEGQLPLMLCAGWVPDTRALRVCELLIDHGADASSRGADGRLAAYACALEAGNAKTAAWLQDKARVAQQLAAHELLSLESGSPDGQSPRGRAHSHKPKGGKSGAGGGSSKKSGRK